MTRVVIFRASDRAEVGPHAHLLADGYDARPGPVTVLRTACGQVGIGRVFTRDAATCGECLATSGQHPGRRSKSHLRKQLTEGRK